MPRWARWSAYWAMIALCVGFAALVVLRQRDDDLGDPAAQSASVTPASPSASPSSPAGTRRVLFVGDAYLAFAASPARSACATLGWTCFFDLGAGSGYTAGRTYASRLASDRRYDPDLVVVTGGRSDVGRGGVRNAAGSYLAAVGRQFPKADLVVVEPFWNDDVTYDAVTALRADVKAAAKAAGATWIPSQGWLGGSAAFLAGGQRLSPGGQRMLTEKLTPALAGLD